MPLYPWEVLPLRFAWEVTGFRVISLPFPPLVSPFHFVGLSTQTPAPLFSNPQDIFLDSWPLPTCQAKDTDLAVRVKIPT